jgi:hypothetical protein
MTWFLSKNKLSEFHFIPRVHKGSDYITVWWGRREWVIYTGKEVDGGDHKEVNFTPLPTDSTFVTLSLLLFIEYASTGFLTKEEYPDLYYCDVRFASDIKVDWNNLKGQASEFIRRKQQGRWYPTHVVWYDE